MRQLRRPGSAFQPVAISFSLFAVAILCVLLTQLSIAQELSTNESQLVANPEIARDYERRAFEILYGFDESASIETAMELLTEAANAGSAAAADRLAAAYEVGEGVPQSLDDARRWRRRAAEAGLAYAQYRIGLQYLTGNTVPQDREEARRWLGAAAAQGEAQALSSLAGTYVEGSYETTDTDTIEAMLTRAAELGDPHGFRLLGTMLLLSPDRSKAARGILALEAAAPSFPELARDIGMHYYRGTKVDRDPERAAHWLSQAVAAGDLFAKVIYAELLRRGLLASPDTVLASQLQDQVVFQANPSVKNEIAWELSVSRDPLMRNGAFAVRLMESLQGTEDGQQPAYLDTMAAAYAETGQFDKAIEYQLTAISLMGNSAGTQSQSSGSSSGPEQRLELYQSRQPYRAPQ